MYQRILVPTDGSATAQRAVDHALSIAERFDAELVALYVVDEGLFDAPLTSGELDTKRILSKVETQAQEITQQVADAAASRGLQARAIVGRSKRIADGILDRARDEDVDVIVMGTHGRSGLTRFLVGSVAERVLRGSQAPVVLVPPAEETGESEHAEQTED